MKKLDIKLRRLESRGLIHNSKTDIHYVSSAVNTLIDKVNELVAEINILKNRGTKNLTL
jgi:hypothetical protein